MRFVTRIAAVGGLAGALLAGCAGKAAEPLRGPPPVPIRQVTEAQAGAAERLRVNEPIEVRLSGAVAAGYEWTLDTPADSAVLKQIYRYTHKTTPPGMVGGAQTEVWQFLGAGPGKATLSFTYKRPWEPEAAQKASFTFEVE